MPAVAMLVITMMSGIACAKRMLPALPPAADLRTGWVDLPPGTLVRLDHAYFRRNPARQGSASQSMEDYIATEAASFRVGDPRGLEFLGLEGPISPLPPGQPATQDLIPRAFRRFRHYRYYYAIVFARSGRPGGAALLAANSVGELERLSTAVAADADRVCRRAAPNCVVFPPTATASLLVDVSFNGEPRRLIWNTKASALAPNAAEIEIQRPRQGVVTVRPGEAEWVETMLLPGDAVRAKEPVPIVESPAGQRASE